MKNLKRLLSIFLIVAVSGLLYWLCFSPSFYSFVMSLCEVCNGK